MGANWYCIRTATRQEHKVVDGLKELAAEHRLALDVYLPCETRWRRLGHTKTAKHVPLLAGYLFVQIDPQALWRVEGVYGVYRVLRTGGTEERPAAVIPSAFVNELRAAQELGEFDHTKGAVHVPMTKGQKVRVTGGKFVGFVGEIIAAPRNQRVKVMLSLFGKAWPLTIPTAQIEPQAEPQDKAPAHAA